MIDVYCAIMVYTIYDKYISVICFQKKVLNTLKLPIFKNCNLILNIII